MSGQSAMKTVKEVKSTIKSLECNNQMSSHGGSEMNANAKPGSRVIGKK